MPQLGEVTQRYGNNVATTILAAFLVNFRIDYDLAVILLHMCLLFPGQDILHQSKPYHNLQTPARSFYVRPSRQCAASVGDCLLVPPTSSQTPRNLMNFHMFFTPSLCTCRFCTVANILTLVNVLPPPRAFIRGRLIPKTCRVCMLDAVPPNAPAILKTCTIPSMQRFALSCCNARHLDGCGEVPVFGAL